MGGPIHARDESESQVTMIYSQGAVQVALHGRKDTYAAHLASRASFVGLDVRQTVT